MTTKDTKKKSAEKKPKTGLVALSAGALALVAGVGAFFLTRDARADTSPGGGSSKGSKKSKGSKGGKKKGKSDGGSKGPGGDATDNRNSPKDDEAEGAQDETAPKDEREGYFWGDRDKVPEDFDWASNQIWVSPDCSTIACGYWFWAEGTLDGETTRVPMAKLLAAIDKKSDPKVRPPRPEHSGVGQQADLLGILSEHPQRTAYTWVGEYYGGVASAPGHSSTELAEDLLYQASTRTGGNNCLAYRDMWSPGMWDFLGFAATRLDEFRRAVYGDKVFGG